MNLLNTIKVEAEKLRNDRGTRDWGNFKITSTSYLSKNAIQNICGSHGMVGQSFTFKESKDESNNYIYEGSYDCWSD